MIPQTFGARVAALRALVPGLSQQRLDTIAGLHRGHTWQIERDRRENSERETVEAIASALGCSVGWLLVGEGHPVLNRPDLSPATSPAALAAHIITHLTAFAPKSDEGRTALAKLLGRATATPAPDDAPAADLTLDRDGFDQREEGAAA